MDKSNKEIIVIVLLIVIALWGIYPLLEKFEGFNSDVTEFVPVGEQRYGLRGEPLRRSSIDNYFRNDNRQITLSQAGGEMWESNRDPTVQGFSDCVNVKCPGNKYDDKDTCWQCGFSHGMKQTGLPAFPSTCPY